MDRWTGRDHGDNAFAARITETWQTTRIPGSSVSEVDLLALAWFLATAPGMVARLLDGQGRKVARVFEAATRRKR